MPRWENIEDVASSATSIWLEREKDEDDWRPLRKVDCITLNNSPNSNAVLIECGRATADPQNGVIRYNFTSQPPSKLCSATWFVRYEKNANQVKLQPIPEANQKIEDFYQATLLASGPLGHGLQQMLQQEITLNDETNKVVLVQSNQGALSLKLKTKSFKKRTIFWTTHALQRGYGEYEVEGEEEESMLGPVKDVVFIVHGIGEAMLSRDDLFVNVENHRRSVDKARATMCKLLVEDWKRKCERAVQKRQASPPIPNRIELIPIEWYDRIHSSSSPLMNSLRASTLPTIPALRQIANDVVFDVLMYLTPEFCEATVDCVTMQVNDLYEGFKRIHPQFVPNGGRPSLVGFSLGSVIVWDLLAIRKEKLQAARGTGTKDDPMDVCGSEDYSNQFHFAHGGGDASKGTWGPSLPKPMKTSISFTPHVTALWGSPVGMFLTLRGAHGLFDQMRFTEKESVVSPFTLPTGAFYNVFHPSDPVAYRIEPMLLPQDMRPEDFPPPLYVVKFGEDVRFHVKAMQVSDDIIKAFTKTPSMSSIFKQVAESAAAALQAADAKKQEDEPNGDKKRSLPTRTSETSGTTAKEDIWFPLGGRTDRIDYQLQPRVVDNEYLAAVSAHSSYFSNQDNLMFLIEMCHKTDST